MWFLWSSKSNEWKNFEAQSMWNHRWRNDWWKQKRKKQKSKNKKKKKKNELEKMLKKKPDQNGAWAGDFNAFNFSNTKWKIEERFEEEE